MDSGTLLPRVVLYDWILVSLLYLFTTIVMTPLFTATIEQGKLSFASLQMEQDFGGYLHTLEGKRVTVTVEKEKRKRSNQQNKEKFAFNSARDREVVSRLEAYENQDASDAT